MPADTRWWTQPTPIGDLAVVTRDGVVVRMSLPGATVGPEAVPGAVVDRDDVVAAQLDEYFAGTRTRFDVEVSFEAVSGDFRRRVLRTLREHVGFGETVSYGELAQMAGSPGAFRAVGSAMATNPVPILVPCHRVLASGGRIGGYGGGLEMKRTLLAHEGVEVA